LGNTGAPYTTDWDIFAMHFRSYRNHPILLTALGLFSTQPAAAQPHQQTLGQVQFTYAEGNGVSFTTVTCKTGYKDQAGSPVPGLPLAGFLTFSTYVRPGDPPNVQDGPSAMFACARTTTGGSGPGGGPSINFTDDGTAANYICLAQNSLNPADTTRTMLNPAWQDFAQHFDQNVPDASVNLEVQGYPDPTLPAAVDYYYCQNARCSCVFSHS
jgi:hypothetical protein